MYAAGMVLAFKSTFRTDSAAVNTLLHGPGGDVRRWLHRKGAEMEAGARAQAGVRTGKLKASIAHDVERTTVGLRLIVSADARVPGRPDLSYAYYHHEGTRPRTVTAGRGESMKFAVAGRTIHTRVIQHPGARPNKFLSSQLVLLKTP